MESPTNVVHHVNVSPGSEKKTPIPEFIESPIDNIYTFEKDASKTKYVSITSKQIKTKKKLTVRYLLKMLVKKH